MSISSSLNAGVAGLSANSIRLATIADNIANSSTNGYKRMESDFNSVVINGSSGAGAYSAGGVRGSSFRVIDQRGTLIGTNHPLDIAVTGKGMLPVLQEEHLGRAAGDRPLNLASTGSFRLDENGVLKTQSGLVLMGWPANADGSFSQPVRDSAAGLQPITVTNGHFKADPTTEVSLNINLPATGTQSDASGDPLVFSIEYFGNLGTRETLTVEFAPALGHASGKSNEWTMTIRDSATPGQNAIASYTVTFNDGMENGGSLASITPISGAAYDPAAGTLPLAVGGGTINLALGKAGGSAGLSQVGDRMQQAISKNGSAVGNLVGLQIDEGGYVKATYDSGFVRTLYKVPLVDVPNVNGLTASNNQTYQVSKDSGDFFLWDAGDGPTGKVTGFALEGSAVDVAAELTNLIQTQRAYSSNAKIIQTVDEMLQETTNIKR